MKSQVQFNPVTQKIPFPIQDVEGFEEFLEPGDLIKSDDSNIRLLAQQLSQGKDDLYDVVYTISQWTRDNINYSLDTLTAEAKQDAVWVLDNRRGVCDELTILFISLLRSLDIPTKFVSGSSYTDVIGGFGNHAWAEVYFPGQGWIAFDPTYGQIGMVDATHIKMDESPDARDSSIVYSWKASQGSVSPKELGINVTILEKGSLIDFDVDLNVIPLNNEVKAGSFIPVEVQAINKEPFYLPLNIFVTKGPSVLEDNSKLLLLPPGGKQSVFYVIPTPGDVDENLLYTSELEVVNSFNDKASALLKYAAIYDTEITLEQAEKKISSLGNGNGGPVSLTCISLKDVYYLYEQDGRITCSVQNTGTKQIDSLELCFRDLCKTFSLPLSGEEKFEFAFDLEEQMNELAVHLQGDDLSQYSYIPLKILDKPSLTLDDLEIPSRLSYKDEGEIIFNLRSGTKVNDLVISIEGDTLFTLDSFINVHSFKIPFQGSFFYKREPLLTITYTDANGQMYEVEQALEIEITDAPWYAGIIAFFRNLF